MDSSRPQAALGADFGSTSGAAGRAGGWMQGGGLFFGSGVLLKKQHTLPVRYLLAWDAVAQLSPGHFYRLSTL